MYNGKWSSSGWLNLAIALEFINAEIEILKMQGWDVREAEPRREFGDPEKPYREWHAMPNEGRGYCEIVLWS